MSWLAAWERLPRSELVLASVLVLLAVLLIRALASADRPPTRSLRRLASDETANATLDFTLVFPIFVMVILVLAQLSLLINARLVVGYAAFAACRSAVVWLEEGEAVAAERAEKAAEVGCLPISPANKVPGIGWVHALPVAPLYVHDLGSGVDFVRRVVRGGSKLAYSKLATDAEIHLPSGQLGAHDPVTVEVEHRFYLSVPYGDRLFRDTGSGPFGLPFRTIRARFTLTNEGRVETR